MNKSQFEAGTFGVGELITQRKLFRVPRHQRSYAWTRDAVSTFLSDVEAAFLANAAEYFIGLVVIQGPEDGEWVLLDGQQRLTTSTMLFAAIRNWLVAQDLIEDARQIETEFLGVRRLGGEYSSRMQLNDENQDTFSRTVVSSGSAGDAKSILSSFAKKTSNRLLVEAAIECQDWINNIAHATGGDLRDRAQRLFRLSAFIESKVKVVCVEVSNDVDPYILFESLNDRGVELSALDLLKNYAYSKSTGATTTQFDKQWERLLNQLDDRNPDDFLKTSWTARHGLVQKTQLFRNIRKSYRTQADVLVFLATLAKDANTLAALEDPEHVLWNNFGEKVRENIYVLTLLGSRQVRPVILAAIGKLPDLVEKITRYLIVIVIRFQIIGRGRTGVMEKVFGKLCSEISNGNVATPLAFVKAIGELWIDDAEFSVSFATHQDSRLARFSYFLAELEISLSQSSGYRGAPLHLQEIIATSRLIQMVRKQDLFGNDDNNPIGCYFLLENSNPAVADGLDSQFSLTSGINGFRDGDGELDYVRRSIYLGKLAAHAWKIVI